MVIDAAHALVLGGAAVALGLSGIGSVIGITKIGQASEVSLIDQPDRFGVGLIFTVLAESPAIYGLLVAILIVLQIASKELTMPIAIAAFSAGLVMGISGLFSAIGIGKAGSTAIGALVERKDLFGKSLIFTIFPETVAIYGLLTSIIILLPAGLAGAVRIETVAQALATLFAAIVVGLTSITGLYLGNVASTSIKTILEDDTLFGKALILAVLPESVAIYGLLIGIVILRGAGIL